MPLIKLSIPNWSKYNPRSDRANYSWFRFENSFFNSHQIFEMNDSQRVLFIALICEASKKNSADIEVSPNLLAAILNSTAQKILYNIQALNGLGVIVTASCRQKDGEPPSSLPATIRDERDERTNDNAHSDEFVEFYSGYPRKIGKAQGLKAYRRERKAGASAEDLLLARDKFRAHHEAQGTEPKFTPYPATMLSDWKQWLDPETGTSDLVPAKKTSDDSAQKILAAIKAVPPGKTDELRARLGDELFKTACRVPGGFTAIRQMPMNDFTISKLKGLLKEAEGSGAA